MIKKTHKRRAIPSRRLYRILRILSFSLGLGSIFLFSGCRPFNNPVDPAADSYQGYDATRISEEMENSVFVSSAHGDDATGKGTYDSPFATIQQGLAYAVAEGFPAVRVTEGYYPVDGAGAPEIALVEGISLYGGYSYPDWFHAPEIFVTEVIDTRVVGGAVGAPNACIVASGGITGATEISGFHIFGSGTYSTSIFCELGASPVISNNYIDGGVDPAATETYGIVINDAAALVEENTIIGGHGDLTIAIDISGLYNPVIKNNIIFGGEAVTTAYGIRSIAADVPLIEENEIDGGYTGTTYGIYLENSSPDIKANRISGGRATTGNAYGIYNFSFSSPKIENNDIIGGEGPTVYGIYCDSSGDGIVRENHIEGGSGNTVAAMYVITSAPGIVGNTIFGSPGGDTITGLFLNNSSPIIKGNRIASGFANINGYAVQCTSSSNAYIINNIISGEEAAGNASGLFCVNSSPLVLNNLIFGGSAPSSYAVNIGSPMLPSTPSIDNNIIIGGPNGLGIYVADLNSDPSTIRHNDIFDCPNGLYDDPNVVPLFDIPSIEALDPANYYGNVSFDPVFANPSEGDVRLTSSSPMEVREGGLDGSALGWLYNTDLEGSARTGNGSTGWSMGPYEYD